MEPISCLSDSKQILVEGHQLSIDPSITDPLYYVRLTVCILCLWVHLFPDARIKSKFWGKSMEVFPVGTVNVTIPKSVNSLTACVEEL